MLLERSSMFSANVVHRKLLVLEVKAGQCRLVAAPFNENNDFSCFIAILHERIQCELTSKLQFTQQTLLGKNKLQPFCSPAFCACPGHKVLTTLQSKL